MFHAGTSKLSQHGTKKSRRRYGFLFAVATATVRLLGRETQEAIRKRAPIVALVGIHTGDAHIDSDVHGKLNPKTGLSTAWESNARALGSAVHEAIERNVDFFIHAGDCFKNGRPSQEAVLLAAETFRPLVEAGIPLVLIDGNHERLSVPTNQRTATTTLSEILASRGEVHVVEREPRLIRLTNGLQIACLPWLSKTSVLARLGEPALEAEFGDKIVSDFAIRSLEQMCAEADTTAPLLMASHITADDVRIDSVAKGHRRGSEMDIAHLFAEPILPRKAVEGMPFAYVALSHIHARQRMGTKCFYAGSTNRITMTDADDAKSVNLITLSDNNALERVDFLPTNARHMHSIDLTADDAEERLEALEPESLVGLKLAPGETVVPPSIKDMIAAAGATIVATTKVVLDRPRRVTAVLPEKTTPVMGLKTWLKEKGYNERDDIDVQDVLAKAAALIEESGK